MKYVSYEAHIFFKMFILIASRIISLLLRVSLSSAVNVLANSHRILDVHKRDFAQLNLSQNDKK